MIWCRTSLCMTFRVLVLSIKWFNSTCLLLPQSFPKRGICCPNPGRSSQCESLSGVHFLFSIPTTSWWQHCIWKQQSDIRVISCFPHLWHLIRTILSTWTHLTDPDKATRTIISDLWPASAVGFTEVITEHLIFYQDRRQHASTNELNLRALYCCQGKKKTTLVFDEIHIRDLRQLLGQHVGKHLSQLF